MEQDDTSDIVDTAEAIIELVEENLTVDVEGAGENQHIDTSAYVPREQYHKVAVGIRRLINDHIEKAIREGIL